MIDGQWNIRQMCRLGLKGREVLEVVTWIGVLGHFEVGDGGGVGILRSLYSFACVFLVYVYGSVG